MIYKNNTIPLKSRIKELFFDYLVIVAYLVCLFGVAMIIYIFFFNGVPKTSEWQSQLIALLTSVIPIILIFSYLDFAKNGSVGKRKADLTLVYQQKSIKASVIRNCVKFLPWQIGHMGTIHGVYTNFDDFTLALYSISIIFGFLLLSMSFFRKDKRHLGDLLVNTQVQMNGEKEVFK